MKRVWRRFMVGVLVCACLAIAVVAVRASGNTHQLHLKGWVVDLETERFATAGRRYFGHELKEIHQAIPQLDLTLSFSPVNNETVGVTGQGQIRVGKDTYALTMGQGERVNVADTPEGKLYVGGLQMSVATREGPVPTNVVLLYRPKTNQTLANISVGTIGQEVLLSFGEHFLTSEQMKSLGSKAK